VSEELAACSFKVYAVQEDFGQLVLFRLMVVIKKNQCYYGQETI
jgi:hypothetical protein